MEASISTNCNCNKPAQVTTVKKEGPNHGRLFATCASRECKYFEWLDGKNKNFAAPSSSSSSADNLNFGLNSSSGKTSTSSFNSRKDRSEMMIVPKCQHQQDAMLLRVKKEGPNQGRLFWTCANPQSDKCSFFSWFSGKEEDYEHLIGMKPNSSNDQAKVTKNEDESEKKRKLDTNDLHAEEQDNNEPTSEVNDVEPQRKKLKESSDHNNGGTVTTTSSSDTNNPLIEYLLDSSWKSKLEDEFSKSYFKKLEKTVNKHYKEKPKQIFPKKDEIFSALNACSYDNVKVVILGQDPYPQWYAHGMSFSVKKGISTPKSLQNIYSELEHDENLKPKFTRPNHGYLMGWAKQGVLLLNAVLTVESGKSNEHKGIGWEQFTDAIINKLKEKKNIVYLLWGKDAQEKGSKIDRKNNLVIQTSHPSPFSADKGFLGSKCFSKCNEYLENHSVTPINWSDL
ncbi:hypothetical protein FDP41_006134 [Naegleria fowleri]|uniref:Uracil-DNA glycosylase n=1 Tax=Naegleria fowleri TaxID=5763 RepID=A0A6A5BKY1_NAEFO|nr:uncharacterized protein FDP41_006134 [Naegleria fowleri]KAF0974660.1 hypothetical protein FDP41_006134 [Naegleria fowleri]